MNSKSEKDDVMGNLTYLKHAEDDIRKIRITDDYTLNERREIKIWLDKANEKNKTESGQFVWKVRGSPKEGMRLAKFRKEKQPSNTVNIKSAS